MGSISTPVTRIMPLTFIRRFSGAVVAALVLFCLFGAAVCPPDAAASDLDARAHSLLTDGELGDPAAPADWVRMFADATVLPKTDYAPHEAAFYGVTAPHVFSPLRHPNQYALVRDANIRGVKFDANWNGIQKQGPNETFFNWLDVETEINMFINDGFSVFALLGSTPGWANGMLHRSYPPNDPVEEELVTFTGDTMQLQNSPLIVTELDVMPIVVYDENSSIRRVEEEIITTNFQPFGLEPTTSQNPVIVGTEEVWIDEHDGRGWVKWTRIDNLLNSPDGAEHYLFNRQGRVKFRDVRQFYFHGKTPAAGADIKVSYDTIDDPYEWRTEYRVDELTGEITRVTADLEGVILDDDFTEEPLNPLWDWLNPPAVYDIGVSGASTIHYPLSAPTTGVGHFLHQTLTGTGDFSASVRVAYAPQVGNSQTGICVYQDEDNWFRFALTTNQGRMTLTRCVDGVVTVEGAGGELGYSVYAPKWLTVRKYGNRWGYFYGNSPTAPEPFEREFTQELNYPLKVGVSSVGTDPTGVYIDRFLVKTPRIPQGATVKVSYNYLNTQPFADYCRVFAEHFKDRIKYYEIYNEPDQRWAFRGSQEIYSILLRDASQAIKEADPEAKVMNGGYADSATGYLRNIYNTIGSEPFDYVAWHPYLYSSDPPDISWVNRYTNILPRQIMAEFGDADKEVFFSEIAAHSGVLHHGKGSNDWKQAEYGMRMFLHSRHWGWVKALNWWPVIDRFPVGNQEEHYSGGHEGLFYADSSIPKPMYWMFRNAASNKGLIMDLVSYDPSGDRVPAGGLHNLKQVTLSVRDLQNLEGVRVLTSRTSTDESSRPPRVAARSIGQPQAVVYVVNVDQTSPELKHEGWTLTALTPFTFDVVAEKSGHQGIAAVGAPFISDNGAVSFVLPAGPQPYVPGNQFVFETFAGDGFALAAEWQNTGQEGAGDITLQFEPTAARYVSLELIKKNWADSVDIGEVQVLNEAEENVAAEKLYLLEGYQPEFMREYDSVDRLGDLHDIADGAAITLQGVVLYQKSEDFAYISAPDRSTGIRLEGALTADAGMLVDVRGTLQTSEGGERYILVSGMEAGAAAEVAPLGVNTANLTSRLVDGLLVRVFGKVVSEPDEDGLFHISDGAGGSIAVSGVEDEVSVGEFLILEGAAGWNNGRIIHASPQ